MFENLSTPVSGSGVSFSIRDTLNHQEHDPTLRDSTMDCSATKTLEKRDTPMQAFLRAKKINDGMSMTQHTATTLGESCQDFSEYNEEDFDDSDNLSVLSIDIFTREDLFTRSEYNAEAVDEALMLSSELDCYTDEETMERNNGNKEFEDQLSFNDSMSSLNLAFEKLNKCMERSALTRNLIRHYSEKSLSVMNKDENPQANHVKLEKPDGCLNGLNSSSSLSSIGNASWKKDGLNKSRLQLSIEGITINSAPAKARLSLNTRQRLQRELIIQFSKSKQSV